MLRRQGRRALARLERPLLGALMSAIALVFERQLRRLRSRG
jgi:hypothetical protein